MAGGRLLGLSAGTRIGGVPAVVVSTTVSAASAGGSTVCHRRPYRLACGLSLAIMLLWGIYIASLCADMADPRSRPFEPAETFDEPVPYITEKGLQEVQAIHWDNWLTTDQWWTFEGMGDWETENRYYRLRFPWLADDLVDGILADYQEKAGPVTAWQIPGLDETWCPLATTTVLVPSGPAGGSGVEHLHRHHGANDRSGGAVRCRPGGGSAEREGGSDL